MFQISTEKFKSEISESYRRNNGQYVFNSFKITEVLKVAEIAFHTKLQRFFQNTKQELCWRNNLLHFFLKVISQIVAANRRNCSLLFWKFSPLPTIVSHKHDATTTLKNPWIFFKQNSLFWIVVTIRLSCTELRICLLFGNRSINCVLSSSTLQRTKSLTDKKLS